MLPEFTESDHEVLVTSFGAKGRQFNPDFGRLLHNPDLKQLARAFKNTNVTKYSGISSIYAQWH